MRRGFTLIELSIVLVIIALVVSGIVAGRELIEQSKIRKLLTQKERFATAANTFRNKYACLPGDCTSGTALGFSGGTGNNDGIIYHIGNDEAHFWFWRHLNEAGLITERADRISGYVLTGDASPTCDICTRRTVTAYGPPYFSVGGWGVNDLSMHPALHCAVSGTSHYPTIPTWRAFALASGNYEAGTAGNTVPIRYAQTIDVKIDDGKPFTGDVIVYDQYMYSDDSCSGYNGLLALNPPWGVNNAGNYYNPQDWPDSAAADMFMKAGF